MICGSEGSTVDNGVEVVAATTSAAAATVTTSTANETINSGGSSNNNNNNNQNNTTVISGNEVLSVSTADLAQMVSGSHGGNVQIRSAQPLTRATRRMLRGHTAHNAAGERVLLINYISPNSTSNNTQVQATNATIIQPSTSNSNTSTRRVIQTRGGIHHATSNANSVHSANTSSTTTTTTTPVSLAGLGSEVTVTLKRSNKSSHNAGHIIRQHQQQQQQQQQHQTTTHSNTIQATTTSSTVHAHSQSPPPLVFTTHTTASGIEHHELQEVDEIEDSTQHHQPHHHHQQQQQVQHHQQQQVIIHHHGNQAEQQQEIQYHHQSQQHHPTTTVVPHLMSIQTQTQATSADMDDDELLEYSTGNVDQVVEAAMAVDDAEDVEEVVETHHIQQLHTVQLQTHQQAECLEDDEGEVEEVYLQ